MPLQDYIARVLWAFAITFLVAYFGTCEGVSLKNGISRNIPQQHGDGLAKELRALPAQETQKMQGSDIAPLKVGYDKAAMLFMKRYVDGLRKRSHETSYSHQKKSIYGPGMYPFYGLYGKRVTEDPRFGYNPEVLDMIRGLIERTEAAYSKQGKMDKLNKESKEAEATSSEETMETKDDNNKENHKSDESKELNQVIHPKVTSTDQEDKAAKVTAYEDEADEKTLKELKDSEGQNKH